MDTVTAFAQRRPESVDAVATVTLEQSRTLAVTATYLLSEDGRKASLLAGGDGREVQELTVQVAANRLHLVRVDANGVARLKLRPRYQLEGEQRIIRIDSPPVYDTAPDLEDLFREAARNHQLERAYETERLSAREQRREAGRERRTQVARTFLDDPAQRALVHPTPTPTRCYLATEQGRVLFDAIRDDTPAREVPSEAHRRFRADLRGRREHNLQERAAQLALHEQKQRVIAEWIAAHGTAEQQARHAAGVLPIAEAIEAITDEAFAVLGDRPRYEHDGIDRLNAHLRCHPEHADVVVTRDDVIVASTNGQQMTAAQWALVQEFQRFLPDATVTLRVHKIAWKRDLHVSLPPVCGVLVTQRVGPFTVRREYAVPGQTVTESDRQHVDAPGMIEQTVG